MGAEQEQRVGLVHFVCILYIYIYIYIYIYVCVCVCVKQRMTEFDKFDFDSIR